MASGWRRVIPEELHGSFERQIRESVAHELMQVFHDEDNVVGKEEADALESRLNDTHTARLVEMFRNGRWPAKNPLSHAAAAASSEPKYWVCGSCAEHNSHSFETCKKCNENKPETSTGSRVVQALVQHVPRIQAGWTCTDCERNNSFASTLCSQCGEHQDTYRRHTWPPFHRVADPAKREEMRQSLFNQIREELGIDDPFACTDISHEEFFATAERLKLALLSQPPPCESI